MSRAQSGQASAKLYFGYGSNLWIEQMHSRCPKSHYVGIGRLNGYKWIINDRGYANVVELPQGSSASTENEVWGLIFYLHSADEPRLDRNEGVPYAYTKEILDIDFWAHDLADLNVKIDVNEKFVTKETLVYIDRKRVTEDGPKDEYVVRMNNGIADALTFGVPEVYVRKVMRKFIPAQTNVDSRTLQKAGQQALDFRDENEE